MLIFHQRRHNNINLWLQSLESKVLMKVVIFSSVNMALFMFRLIADWFRLEKKATKLINVKIANQLVIGWHIVCLKSPTEPFNNF